MLEHNQIRDALARELKEHIPDGDRIHTEFYLDPPRWVSTRRVDVVWEFDDKSAANGIAFEVKSSSRGNKRIDGLRQLHSNAISGYYPTLVVENDHFHDASGNHSSFEDLVRTICASYVDVNGSLKGDEDLSFELVRNEFPSELEIPDCF